MRKQQGTHPVRKVLHMQKFYPETVMRLNKRNGSSIAAASSPEPRPASCRWLRNPSPNNKNTSPYPSSSSSSSAHTCHGTKDPGHGVSDGATGRRLADEYQFCHNKMAFNRAKGRYVDELGSYDSHSRNISPFRWVLSQYTVLASR